MTAPTGQTGYGVASIIAAVHIPSHVHQVVTAAHRRIAAAAPGGCGIWHHEALTPATIAAYANRLPHVTRKPEGWVRCWQHEDGDCPGPDLAGGTVHLDLVLPAVDRIHESFAKCPCRTHAAVADAWHAWPETVQVDAAGLVTLTCLKEARHLVERHGAHTSLPPYGTEGFDVLEASWVATVIHNDAGAVAAWDRLLDVPDAVPGTAGDEWLALDWRASVTASAYRACEEAALMLRRAVRWTIPELDADPLPGMPCTCGNNR
jgi:hypothetical protein